MYALANHMTFEFVRLSVRHLSM